MKEADRYVVEKLVRRYGTRELAELMRTMHCPLCHGTGKVRCVTCGAGPCAPVNERSVCGMSALGTDCPICDARPHSRDSAATGGGVPLAHPDVSAAPTGHDTLPMTPLCGGRGDRS